MITYLFRLQICVRVDSSSESAGVGKEKLVMSAEDVFEVLVVELSTECQCRTTRRSLLNALGASLEHAVTAYYITIIQTIDPKNR